MMFSPSLRSPRRSNLRFSGIAVVVFAALTACGQASDAEPADEPISESDAAPEMTVRIVEPADGSTHDSGDVVVRFEVDGLTIAPAGTMDAGTGHHHLVVDTTLARWDEPIPALPGRFIHFGQGQTEVVLEGLEPGTHTVVAVVGDGVHIPLDPPVVDTVVFTVREP